MARVSPAPTGGVFTPERRSLSIGLLLTVLLIAFESLGVATVLPLAVPELGGLPLYGWAFSAFFMGYLLSTVALGSLADGRGPDLPFALALALFALGLFVAGSAPSMPVLIFGRALQGLGGGGLIAVAYFAINRAYPDALRARMLALLSSAWVLPALVGPLIAGWVATHFSWRAIFLGLLPLLLPVALLALAGLRGLKLPGGAPMNFGRLGAALALAVGATLALAALQQSAPWWGASLGLGGLALGVPALARLFPPDTWRLASPLAAGYATRFVLTFAFFGGEAFVPLSLTRLHGYGAVAAGLTLTASALAWSGTSILHARFDERTAGRWRAGVVRLGSGVVTLALALSGFALLGSWLPTWTVGLTWALGGVGMGLAFQAHTLVVFAHAPAGQEGEVSGNIQLADVLGAALGAGIGGALVAGLGLRPGVAWLFVLVTAVMALGLFTAGRLRSAPQNA